MPRGYRTSFSLLTAANQLAPASRRWCRSSALQLIFNHRELFSGFMGIRPHDVEKTMRALRRRHPLLEAWLEALDRLEGPRCRIATVRNTAQRRPLMQSVERHRIGRRRPSHLVIVQPGP